MRRSKVSRADASRIGRQLEAGIRVSGGLTPQFHHRAAVARRRGVSGVSATTKSSYAAGGSSWRLASRVRYRAAPAIVASVHHRMLADDVHYRSESPFSLSVTSSSVVMPYRSQYTQHHCRLSSRHFHDRPYVRL